jgi:dTMP kinase
MQEGYDVFSLSKEDLNHLKGKIIVFEGVDGSGKKTQFTKLLKLLKHLQIPVKTFDYPQYEKTAGGKLLANILWRYKEDDKTETERWHYPHPDGLSPYLLALPYAVDRAHDKDGIKQAIKDGYVILFNRYWTSNAGHQTGKIRGKDYRNLIHERRKFIQYLQDVELVSIGLPKEDIVFYMDVCAETVFKTMSNRETKNDLVEDDDQYQNDSIDAYRWLCSEFDHWVKISCENETNCMHSPEVIHSIVIKKLVDLK